MCRSSNDAAVTRAQASVLVVDTGKTNNLRRATLGQAYHSQNRRDETATTTNLAARAQGQWGSALGQAQGDRCWRSAQIRNAAVSVIGIPDGDEVFVFILTLLKYVGDPEKMSLVLSFAVHRIVRTV